MNSSGFVIDVRGVIPEMLDWLARRYHFRYVFDVPHDDVDEVNKNFP